jgi:hypothetical protein
MSIWGQSIKAKQDQNKMYIAALTEESKIIASAREHGMKDTHFAWTRRIIALSAIFSIIVLPKVAALVAPIAELPWLITVGYTEIQGGKFKEVSGIGYSVQKNSWNGGRLTASSSPHSILI